MRRETIADALFSPQDKSYTKLCRSEGIPGKQ